MLGDAQELGRSQLLVTPPHLGGQLLVDAQDLGGVKLRAQERLEDPEHLSGAEP